MDALFSHIDYWHWWILAGILLILEISAPSFFFLWLAIAAIITGFVLLAMPDLGWQYQFLTFSGLAIVSIAAFRRYQRSRPTVTDQPSLNRRGGADRPVTWSAWLAIAARIPRLASRARPASASLRQAKKVGRATSFWPNPPPSLPGRNVRAAA